VEKKESFRLTLNGLDLEDLLVVWLSELLYYQTTKEKLFCEFEIKKIDDKNLDAWVYGDSYDPKKHSLKKEIKTVTYHQIKVEKVNDLWRTQVIFDV
jgi:SHS2 domain-containing protein